MSLMLVKTYTALKSAGAPEDEAQAAAEEIAGFEDRFNRLENKLTILTWMVGLIVVVEVIPFFKAALG